MGGSGKAEDARNSTGFSDWRKSFGVGGNKALGGSSIFMKRRSAFADGCSAPLGVARILRSFATIFQNYGKVLESGGWRHGSAGRLSADDG